LLPLSGRLPGASRSSCILPAGWPRCQPERVPRRRVNGRVGRRGAAWISGKRDVEKMWNPGGKTVERVGLARICSG